MPVTASLAQSMLISLAVVQARALGHELGEFERSGTRSAVATCANCKLYAVISTAPDEPKTLGSTLTVRCRGTATRPEWTAERSTALAS